MSALRGVQKNVMTYYELLHSSSCCPVGSPDAFVLVRHLQSKFNAGQLQSWCGLLDAGITSPKRTLQPPGPPECLTP